MIRYTTNDLYPDCLLPDCAEHAKGVHSHVLPHQADIMADESKYLYCQGGVGSAKSIAFAAKCVALSLDVPENEGVVARKDFKLLYKSSWKDVKACLKKLVRLRIIDEPLYSDKRQGDYTTITIKENGSILYAMQTKNWQEALGASYGWFWVDDAMESQEELFVGDETSAGLISRLRLPRATFHRLANGRVASMLRGMVSSNPPPNNHWLHKLFGSHSGVLKLGDDAVRHMQVETFLNPFVGESYAKGLMSVQQRMGHSSDTARRVIFGESVPAYGGLKVYPQFTHQLHVCEATYDPSLPCIRMWDFGVHHPAVIMGQLFTCTEGTNHLICLTELSQLFNVTVYNVYDAVKEHCDREYPGVARWYDCGDRSGYRKSSSNKDKRGDIRILQAEFGLTFKFKFYDVDNSIKYCRAVLDTVCKCGAPVIQVSKRCEVLIEALEGGYKYAKNRASGVASDRPVKDKYYDDIADAWRYGVEAYVKWGIQYRDRTPGYKKVKSSRSDKPWSWMDATDAEIVEALIAP